MIIVGIICWICTVVAITTIVVALCPKEITDKIKEIYESHKL